MYVVWSRLVALSSKRATDSFVPGPGLCRLVFGMSAGFDGYT